MKELFLFVRPPRPLWPFSGPSSAFWPPLAFASMAAALRERLPDLRVAILDAPALQMGWRTLEAELHRLRPAYIGMGEEAVSCVEAFRLARLARGLRPDFAGADPVGRTRVIAGGCFFGHAAAQTLGTGLVDVIVHGEGERTLCDLVPALRDGTASSLAGVNGISYLEDGKVVSTPAAPLISDLDTLPFPAYDLLPMERYGRGSRNHPDLASIELGRGCVGSCDFCILWRQMGRFVGGQPVAHYRAKSPERLLEEIRILSTRHGRRYLGWVDPCYNAHPAIPGQLSELLLRENLRPGQSAWVRADSLVRDSASGALKSCVNAGLNEVYIGIERPDDAGLAGLGKTSHTGDARTALDLLHREHPHVLTVGSFIYGLPGDTPSTIQALHHLICELGLDQFFFIPWTPMPGTPGWRDELWDDRGEYFRKHSFLPGTDLWPHQRALERALLKSLAFHWPLSRIRATLELLWSPHDRRRRVTGRLFARGLRFQASSFIRGISESRDPAGMVFPAWYES